MSLLAEVLLLLERQRVAHALIGAAAMAIRGVDDAAAVRAEVDRTIHRLSTDARLLWSRLRAEAQA